MEANGLVIKPIKIWNPERMAYSRQVPGNPKGLGFQLPDAETKIYLFRQTTLMVLCMETEL